MHTLLPLIAFLIGAVAAYTYLRAQARVAHAECPALCKTLSNENELLRRDMQALEYRNSVLQSREIELQAKIFSLEQAQAEFPKFVDAEECAA